eukprot:TRINITY_DN7368_c0_g4_i1.p1 TRINITY_DN7368_c0_g4~~TRINITY_DN7368_c0_g4_i1.p1  ORF type:complete len:394 (+),score=51.39 TRINITY_DN7368_c0_g4_i1:49-1230(+)
MLLILKVVLCLVGFVWGRGRDKTLRFNSDRTFTILQITDIHYGEDDFKDFQTSQLVISLIRKAQPDLIVLTGDAVSGYAWNGDPGFFFNNWARFTSPFTITNTRYAYILGNHDGEADLTREQIFDLDSEHPLSLMDKADEITGVNYFHEVQSSYDNATAPPSILWFFDTNREGCRNETWSWGCVEDDQIAWFRKQSSLITASNKNTFDLAFFHIPLQEYMDLWYDGETYGEKNEDVACPRVNTGLFDVLAAQGNVKAVYVGHDHDNYFGGFWKGVELIFGRKTGFGGYGPAKGMLRGARVIKLTEYWDKDELKVKKNDWMLLEDMSIEDNTKSKSDKKAEKRQTECALPNRPISHFKLVIMLILGFVLLSLAVGFAYSRCKSRNSQQLKLGDI